VHIAWGVFILSQGYSSTSELQITMNGAIMTVDE
jgi:hypothetical protein